MRDETDACKDRTPGIVPMYEAIKEKGVRVVM
jgi:hypothetical protein